MRPYDDEVVPRRLGRREAALVRRDLDDLAAFRDTFESGGFKGVSLFCQDCLEEPGDQLRVADHKTTHDLPL